MQWVTTHRSIVDSGPFEALFAFDNWGFPSAAKSSRSPSDLVPGLVDSGFSSTDARAFAEAICARVPREAAAVNVSFLMRCYE